MKNFDFKKLLNYKKYILMAVVALIVMGGYLVKDKNDHSESTLIAKQQRPTKTKKITKSGANSSITVDIFGAIKNQGVYNVKKTSRLNDLIEIAGGLTDKADIKNINRAKTLTDQEKIYIPYQGEIKATPITENSTVASDSENSNKININTADATELQKLNGVGEKKAEQIIAYRDENGDFKDPKELTKVSGIGEKTFAAMADKVTI